MSSKKKNMEIKWTSIPYVIILKILHEFYIFELGYTVKIAGYVGMKNFIKECYGKFKLDPTHSIFQIIPNFYSNTFLENNMKIISPVNCLLIYFINNQLNEFDCFNFAKYENGKRVELYCESIIDNKAFGITFNILKNEMRMKLVKAVIIRKFNHIEEEDLKILISYGFIKKNNIIRHKSLCCFCEENMDESSKKIRLSQNYKCICFKNEIKIKNTERFWKIVKEVMDKREEEKKMLKCNKKCTKLCLLK